MNGWLILLICVGFLTFLITVSMVCSAIETAAASIATGTDARKNPNRRAGADDVSR